MNRFVSAAGLAALWAVCMTAAPASAGEPAKVAADHAVAGRDVTSKDVTGQAAADKSAAGSGEASLFDTVAGLDRQMFDSFNQCDDPAQFERHRALFDSKVEFYHDLGGVTWDREQMLANVRKNVCGKFRRELVPGTLRVYPIKDFGAMEIGEHRFCSSGGKTCEGRGEFILVWRRLGDRWQVTRAISYAHRAND